MRRLPLLPLLALCVVLVLGFAPVQPTPPAWQPVVLWRGAMRNFMKGTDLSGKVLLDTINKNNLYGLGVADGLCGELLAWNGDAWLTTRHRGIAAAHDHPLPKGTRAALFVWAHVPKWRPMQVATALRTFADVERAVASAAAKAGLDTTVPIPFLIQGKADLVKAHVMDWPLPDSAHTMENHKQFALPWIWEERRVDVLGFFSRGHKGVFTHHSAFVHMHARHHKSIKASHVDSLSYGPGMATLYLPAAK